MADSTLPFKNRIALVFDFDLTLGEDCTDRLVEHLGFEPEAFRAERLDDAEGWDATLHRNWVLLNAAREQGTFIRQDRLAEIGADLELFEGVPDLFGRVRDAAEAIVDDVEVVFYVLSGGYVDMIEATGIADEFEAIYGTQWHYDDEGNADFPRRVITHPEKTRYLIALAKGLGVDGHDSPSDVYRHVPEEEWRVPFDQMIYVGDGASDLPAFELMHDRGGIAIGVLKPGTNPDAWKQRDEVRDDQTVQNLAEADYTEGSELLRSILLATESIAQKIALRKLGAGE